MKIPNAPQSSFGIPREMQDQIERAKNSKKEKEREPNQESKKTVTEDWPMMEEDSTEEEPTTASPEEVKENVRQADPFEILKSLGIEPKEEDFHSIIFRGFVEKTVDVAKNPMNGQALTAKIKTLTAEELDWVDELVAESLENVKMTTNGLDIRRTMWVMSFAVSELNGRILVKPVMGDDKAVDIKATAKARRAVISKLSPYIVDTIVRIHAQMSSCYNMIVTDPRSQVLKKS